MKIIVKIAILISLFLYSLVSQSQILNTKVKAKIEISDFEGLVSITGTAENFTEVLQNLHYKLSVIKKSNSNLSNNSQEGRFTLEPKSKSSLSTTKINTTKGDETIILLLIYNEENELLGKDRIVVEKKNNQTQEEIESGLEMKGIVSNETKTKMGKDFYDLFYSKYNLALINAKEIIKIEEEQMLGRTTKIKVTIDNKLINEFIAQPNDEYLTTKTNQTLFLVKKYLAEVKQNNEILSSY